MWLRCRLKLIKPMFVHFLRYPGELIGRRVRVQDNDNSISVYQRTLRCSPRILAKILRSFHIKHLFRIARGWDRSCKHYLPFPIKFKHISFPGGWASAFVHLCHSTPAVSVCSIFYVKKTRLSEFYGLFVILTPFKVRTLIRSATNLRDLEVASCCATKKEKEPELMEIVPHAPKNK